MSVTFDKEHLNHPTGFLQPLGTLRSFSPNYSGFVKLHTWKKKKKKGRKLSSVKLRSLAVYTAKMTWCCTTEIRKLLTGDLTQEVRSQPVHGLWSHSNMLMTVTERNLNPIAQPSWTFLWLYNQILPHFWQRSIIMQTLSFTKSFRATCKLPDLPLCLPLLPLTLGEIRNNPANLRRDLALWETPVRVTDFLTLLWMTTQDSFIIRQGI